MQAFLQTPSAHYLSFDKNSAMAQENPLLSALELTAPMWRNRSSQCRNGGGVVMKRRARFERRRTCGRPRSAVERRVRRLKKLIPNCESMGVERLFRETAEYIMALQMRVKVMQSVVSALSSASDDE